MVWITVAKSSNSFFMVTFQQKHYSGGLMGKRGDRGTSHLPPLIKLKETVLLLAVGKS